MSDNQGIRVLLVDDQELILTTFEDENYLFEGLTAGASGYLLKDTSSAHLTLAIRSVANGSGFLQPEAAVKVVEAYKQLANEPKRRDEANRSLPIPLTQREQEILAYIATESTNRQIAEALFLTEGTVKNYVTSILSKLEVSDRQEARVKAQELGLI